MEVDRRTKRFLSGWAGERGWPPLPHEAPQPRSGASSRGFMEDGSGPAMQRVIERASLADGQVPLPWLSRGPDSTSGPIVSYHGAGGPAFLAERRPSARTLAEAYIRFVLVDYRLAPENPIRRFRDSMQHSSGQPIISMRSPARMWPLMSR